MEQVNSSRRLSSYYVFAGILIGLVMDSTMNSCLAVRVLSPSTKTDTQFLRRSCDATTYPTLCFSSLSSYAAAIQTSPKALANTALSVSLGSSRSTSTMMSTLSKSHGMKPREVAAMRDCVENLSNSIDELRNSMGEMGHLGGSNFGLHMNNIQTWVSAALTQENSCMDDFAGNSMNGNVKTTVRGHMVRVVQLTSNTLALINGLSSSQS
ncbi:21 kDa protein-like [Macadamia integrifolia]|uniref:21 kDa protein-like n=1 Tax=Macadamia integrifolia TaxID=60698 RepID=UPI001C4FB710|nr:21 kDa protein-like [Macadamia integrifolia]